MLYAYTLTSHTQFQSLNNDSKPQYSECHVKLKLLDKAAAARVPLVARLLSIRYAFRRINYVNLQNRLQKGIIYIIYFGVNTWYAL
ncbi:hypothetical protein Mucpa_1704 [Mucilaginibacter paludis DSM 18603]|uniref:Uncharacterized protein n=1 Tax=Mucilaginibacter paludis DSM 18603 TaxID=714943 RepID=H1Y6L5_9SPHI|nr:hypothetical protein Mucpa_1704 [Mucilaginibacter paludis DSM 18603]